MKISTALEEEEINDEDQKKKKQFLLHFRKANP